MGGNRDQQNPSGGGQQQGIGKDEQLRSGQGGRSTENQTQGQEGRKDQQDQAGRQAQGGQAGKQNQSQGGQGAQGGRQSQGQEGRRGQGGAQEKPGQGGRSRTNIESDSSDELGGGGGRQGNLDQ